MLNSVLLATSSWLPFPLGAACMSQAWGLQNGEKERVCQGQLRSSDFVQTQITLVLEKQVKCFFPTWKDEGFLCLFSYLDFFFLLLFLVCFLLFLISGRLRHVSGFWQSPDSSDNKQTIVISNHSIQWRPCLHFHFYLNNLLDCFN